MILRIPNDLLSKSRQTLVCLDANLCSAVKLLAFWLMGAQGTAKGGLWLWTGRAGLCTGIGPAAPLATCGCGGVPGVLAGPQGETGVEGGVNGLNPGEGFLSQALERKGTDTSRQQRQRPNRQ